MSVTTARKFVGFSDISEDVLGEQSSLRTISRKDIIRTPGTSTLKVYVNTLMNARDYSPLTGVTLEEDGSAYVDINTEKDRAVNEILDKLTAKEAPMDYSIQRLRSALVTLSEDMDTNGYQGISADGTEVVAVGGNKPIVSTIYTDLLDLKLQLDNEKAPQEKRYMVITPEMHNLMLQTESKVFLDTSRGDQIQLSGWVGRFLGFEFIVSTLMNAGDNLIAIQERAFVMAERWDTPVTINDLNNQFIGSSAIQGRMAYVYGTVRPELIQINRGAVTV